MIHTYPRKTPDTLPPRFAWRLSEAQSYSSAEFAEAGYLIKAETGLDLATMSSSMEEMEFVPYNPLVETLVHPPSNVAMSKPKPSLFTKLALKLRASGGRRRDKTCTFRGKLPPELWLVVFEIVLAPVLRMHELANSDTIPTTTRTLLRFGMHVLEYDDWPRLRLVCRMFHGLLGPNRYQGIRGLKDNRVLPIGTEALSMLIGNESMDSFSALQDPSALSRIRLLDIMLIARVAGGTVMQDVVDYIYVIAPSLPSLRSLSLCYGGDDRPHVLRGDTWQKISESFPMLEDLCIWASEPIKEYQPAIFKYVKALRARDMPTTDLIRFPSLLYVCAFNWDPEGAFEKLHASTIISLGASHPDIGFNRRILQTLPSARHLGASISSLAELETPPPGHPINHLSVNFEHCGSILSALNREMPPLAQKLKQIPSIDRLSFGREDGLSKAEMEYVLYALRGTNVTSIFAKP